MKFLACMTALVLATWLLPGCSGDGANPVYQGPPWPATCRSDADCDSRKVCSPQAGICVSPMPSGTPLTLSIMTDTSQGLPGDQFNGIETINPGLLDMTLTPPAVVTGVLGRLPEDGGIILPAAGGRLVATGEGIIPGLRFRHESGPFDASTGFRWKLTLVPDVDYQVSFVPHDPLVPPWTWNISAGMSGTRDLDLPPVSSITKISGIVLTPEGESRKPLANAGVTATVGEKLVSSDVTDGDGVFSISIPELEGQVAITVSRGTSGAVFPDRLFTWPSVQDFRQALPDTDFLVLDTGTLPQTARITLYVAGMKDAGVKVSIPGTRLLVRGEVEGGSYLQQTIVDETNFRFLTLPLGEYTIDAVTPGFGLSSRLRASQYSVGQRPLTLDSDQAASFAIELPLRPKISGRVVYDESGEPIAGARIMLASVASELLDLDSPATIDIVHEAITDDQGEFSVRLDPGPYAMRVEPPFGSGLATASWPSVQITGTENLQIGLRDAAIIRGTLRTAGGDPVVNGLVSFYFPSSREFIDAWPLKSASFSTSIRLAGLALTDSRGRFDATLPDPARPATAIGATFVPWTSGP